MKNIYKSSVLRKHSVLDSMIEFLIRNRDILNLAEDPIGKFLHYEFQDEQSSERSVRFASQTLTTSENKYSVTEMEVLGIIFVLYLQ